MQFKFLHDCISMFNNLNLSPWWDSNPTSSDLEANAVSNMSSTPPEQDSFFWLHGSGCIYIPGYSGGYYIVYKGVPFYIKCLFTRTVILTVLDATAASDTAQK
jgi:hypothetical protein